MRSRHHIGRRREGPLDDDLPDVVSAGDSGLERKTEGDVAGRLNIKGRQVVYTSPSGRFTVERLKPGNYPGYRDDLVRIAKEMPDTGPVEAIGDYVNSLVRKIHDAGYIAGMSDTSDFMAKIDGKVVGYVMAAPVTTGRRTKHKLLLGTIGVDPKYGGLGAGSTLYWIAANEAIRRGLPHMKAQSQYDNDDANQLLSRIGFETENATSEYEALVTGCIPYRWKAETKDVLKKTGEMVREKIESGEKKNWRPKRRGAAGTSGRGLLID